MKKRVVAVVLALVILLSAAPLALAAAHHGRVAAKPAKGKPFLAKGAAVMVTDQGTLIATVSKGSRCIRPYIGASEEFTLAKHARVMARVVDPTTGDVGYVKISLAAITPGSAVHINGRLDRSDPKALVFYAQLIKVKLAPQASVVASPSPSPSPSVSDSPSPAPAE